MLQAIREKTSGWIAYLIIGLISVPFALWGINSYLGGGEEQPAAVVDGVDITPRQLDYAYSRYRERLASMFGGRLPAAFADDEMLKEQVLSQVIEEQVLLGYIQGEGYRVSDEELFAVIRSNPDFMLDGKFDAQRYKDQLSSQGYLPAQFEEELRRASEMQQLGNAIRSSGFVLPNEVDRFVQLDQQERKLRLLTISPNLVAIEVSAGEIEQHYNDQSAAFMRPARVKVDYIELDLQTVARNIEVSEDQLLQRYEAQLGSLTTAEYRNASHILLTISSDMDESARQQVREKIENLQNRIQQGEDFAILAKEFSQDPGSAASGGDLGEVEKGVMVKPFENVLFSMSVGEVSEPVETQFGWHLIKLNSIEGGQTPSFQDVRAQLENELRTELAENQIYDLAESLANITYEQFDSLLPASEQLGLKIRSSEWFTQDAGQGVADNVRVRSAAFAPEVLLENRNSDAIELGDNRMLVLHLAQHEPEQLLPLNKVRMQIIDELKLIKARQQATEAGKQVLEGLRSGGSLEQLAQEQGLDIQDLGYIKRNASDTINKDVINLAFTLAKPQPGSMVFEGLSEATGQYTIVELSGVKMMDSVQASERGGVVQKLGRPGSEAEYQAMLKLLTGQASVQRTPVAELK